MFNAVVSFSSKTKHNAAESKRDIFKNSVTVLTVWIINKWCIALNETRTFANFNNIKSKLFFPMDDINSLNITQWFCIVIFCITATL